MPVYIYQHPETQEVKEIVQGMNDVHEYSEANIKWNRIFSVPQAVVDGKISCWSARQFVEKTGNTKGTVGDLFDRSQELSNKRASEAGGIDPLKQKHFEEYSKLRKGRIHPDDPRRTPN